ncbi:MAG: hypothetical protein Q7R76_01985 [Candidatus Woesearchaeota archaeon]|nr:hypothetical protein [Candidatus Woesearchaeota archaeon]
MAKEWTINNPYLIWAVTQQRTGVVDTVLGYATGNPNDILKVYAARGLTDVVVESPTVENISPARAQIAGIEGTIVASTDELRKRVGPWSRSPELPMYHLQESEGIGLVLDERTPDGIDLTDVIAYDCSGCKGIVVGQPEKTGSYGFEAQLSCRTCKTVIFHQDLEST